MQSTLNRQNFELALRVLRPYAVKNIGRANWQTILTLFMLWGNLFLSFYFIHRLPWVLLLTIPVTVVFMCRSYVIEHDCGHYSFYRQKQWNHIIGNAMGFGIMIPFSMWKFIHNSHHQHVGNLDKRNINPEVFTMTVKEFKNSSALKKFAYRCMRSPWMRLTILPIINYGLGARVIHPKYNKKAKASVIIHNLIYLAFFGWFIYYFGFFTLFFIYLLPLFLFFIVAAFTFYAQHQFEDAYWQKEGSWDWKEATMKGATDLHAPLWFRWLIGNVVCHSVHHLCISIPNYKLYDAQKELHKIFDFKYYSMSDVWRFLNLKLWDEEGQKLVSFEQGLKKSIIN